MSIPLVDQFPEGLDLNRPPDTALARGLLEDTSGLRVRGYAETLCRRLEDILTIDPEAARVSVSDPNPAFAKLRDATWTFGCFPNLHVHASRYLELTEPAVLSFYLGGILTIFDPQQRREVRFSHLADDSHGMVVESIIRGQKGAVSVACLIHHDGRVRTVRYDIAPSERAGIEVVNPHSQPGLWPIPADNKDVFVGHRALIEHSLPFVPRG